MTVSIAQKVDLLYKQAFGVTKTDIETNKSPSNESIPSPLLIRGDTVWVQAADVPAVAAAVPSVVQAYTGTLAAECTADITTVPVGGIYPTWLTNLTDWIPAEFGSTYSVQVWVDNPGVANPTVTGTQIFAAGSGGTGEFYFNYMSGVLNFIGGTIPAALTSGKVLYIVGYRYIGVVGISTSGGDTGNITFATTTLSTNIANANITLSPTGTGVVDVTTALMVTGNVETADTVVGNNAYFAENVVANSITIGSSVLNEFSTLTVHTAMTNSTTPDQPIYTIPSDDIAGVDFVIISTDTVGNSRQITKISAVTYGNTLSYNETSTMNAGNYLGDWELDYVSGPPNNVVLTFSPDTANTVVHKLMITKYAP